MTGETRRACLMGDSFPLLRLVQKKTKTEVLNDVSGQEPLEKVY